MGRTVTVTLGEYYYKLVKEFIEKGRYNSVSEVVRAGLRKLEECEGNMPDKVEVKTFAQQLQEQEEKQRREMQERLEKFQNQGVSDAIGDSGDEWRFM